MTKYYKHIGKVKNSGRRCVVIKDRIPGSETNALIADIDSLPDAYQQFLMDLVLAPAAQSSNELGEVLNRYASPDSGKSMLASLNERQYLSAMAINNILMYPAPNFPIELEKVIRLVDGEDVEKVKNDQSVHTLHGTVSKIQAEEVEKNLNVAKNILAEANRLEFEASKKRDAAYAMAPQLNPALKEHVKPTPSLYDVSQTNTFAHEYPKSTPSTEVYGYNAPSSQYVNNSDISEKIGQAPPPIEIKLTPEEIMLKSVCDPNYKPTKIVENIKIEVPKEKPKKTRGRKPVVKK